jgi:hypothetical protein
MTREEIEAKINKNRDEIDRYLYSSLDLGIIYHNIGLLAARNEVLIESLKYLKVDHGD